VVYSAGNGEVEVYELHIPEMWSGHTLGELVSSVKGCFPVALTRAGHSYLPEASTPMEKEDVLHVSTTFEGISLLTAHLAKKAEA